jgi:Icc-related predicted phosphoesterase
MNTGKIKILFSSDLHGRTARYERLFEYILSEKPELVLIGGDVLPSGISAATGSHDNEDFLNEYLIPALNSLKGKMTGEYPLICMIPGNDDPRAYEDEFFNIEKKGLWRNIHNKIIDYKGYKIAGYSFVPPTPFLLKDWEKYDVSRFTDVGCVSPEEGFRSVSVEANHIRFSTIDEDIKILSEGMDMSKSIFLFHSPPYNTVLDRINVGNKLIDYVKPDEHVGSIAIRRFIENNSPLLTLHGHIHESTHITGEWKEYIGKTLCINGSTTGNRLALVRIETEEDSVTANLELV